MPVPDLPGPGDLIYWVDGAESPLSSGFVVRRATSTEVADLPVQDPPLVPPLFWASTFGDSLSAQVRTAGEFYSGLSVVADEWIVGVIKAHADAGAIGDFLT